jgi:hypothetical protein
MNEQSEYLTPWGAPYYGPIKRVGDVAYYTCPNGKRIPLRPRHVNIGAAPTDETPK